jgi:polyisoprenoid-binding protein YceI
MRLHLADGSRVFIDLKAAGLLKAMAHSPTLRATPDAFALDFADGQAIVGLRFPVASIAMPADMAEGDRVKMTDNLRGAEVLDARRYPAIDFRGRYTGSTEGGTLAGELVVRGVPARVSMPVRVQRQWDALAADASWQGTLTALGVKPYKALLGAIKLEDWIGLRFEVRFRELG